MKKKMILALVAIAAVAAPTFAVAFHGHQHQQGVNNSRCTACNGTGFGYGPRGKGTGNLACPSCHGTGFYGSY